MAHFNFAISQNATWGHAGFYIDCHRMTVPENILLQKSTALMCNCRQCRVEGSRDVDEQKLVLQRVPGKQTAKYTVIYQSKTPSDL